MVTGLFGGNQEGNQQVVTKPKPGNHFTPVDPRLDVLTVVCTDWLLLESTSQSQNFQRIKESKIQLVGAKTAMFREQRGPSRSEVAST